MEGIRTVLELRESAGLINAVPKPEKYVDEGSIKSAGDAKSIDCSPDGGPADPLP